MDIKKYSIYRITNPNGKIYIGQSCNVKTRIKWYKRCASDQPAIYNSIKKYGYKNHTFEILLENLDKETADIVEIGLIKYYRITAYNGKHLNIADGGSSGATYNSKKIYQYTLEGKYLKSFKSITCAAQELQVDIGSICNVLYGRSKRCKTFIFSLVYKRKIEPYKEYGRRIYQYDFDNNLLKVWNNVSELSKELNISQSALYKKLQRKESKCISRCKFQFKLFYHPLNINNDG